VYLYPCTVLRTTNNELHFQPQVSLLTSDKMGRKVHAAAVHAAPIFMNKAATLAKVTQIIREAKKQNIELLAFPETFVPGYPYFIECYPPIKQVAALAEYAEQSVTVRDDLDEVRAVCREAEISICLGISERVPDGFTLFNSQVYIDSQGKIKGVHRKLQPTYVERMVWAQGGGHTLRTYDSLGDFKIGGLCCWENTMPLARQALSTDGEEIHVGAWPALNTMSGFESAANAQIEALMKNHALTGQTFVLCTSNYVDDTCLDWMEKNLGKQDSVKAGGGWSAIVRTVNKASGYHVVTDC
jgi:nitrilase